MKKILISALFALSLFQSTTSAQDYKLHLALSNFQGTYSDGSDIVDIPGNSGADIFLDSTWQSFLNSLNSFPQAFLDVSSPSGGSFKDYVLAKPEVRSAVASLVNWVLTDQQPSDHEGENQQVHFSKTGGVAGGQGEEFCAHYEDTIHGAKPVEVVVYIKKLSEVNG